MVTQGRTLAEALAGKGLELPPIGNRAVPINRERSALEAVPGGVEVSGDIAAIAAGLSAEMREQMLMKAGSGVETTWSGTHGWPGLRDRLECKGLIVSTNRDDWKRTTITTPLGLAVRAYLEGHSNHE